jgi:hypothetical protein
MARIRYLRFNPALPGLQGRNLNGGGGGATFFLGKYFGVKAADGLRNRHLYSNLSVATCCNASRCNASRYHRDCSGRHVFSSG